MCGIEIRVAGPGDVWMLARLRHRWTEETEAGTGDGSFEGRFARWYEDERRRRTFWLAEVGREPVGMVNLLVFERMPRPGRDAGRWGYLGNMFVVREHRLSGIGAMLLAAVLSEASAVGLQRVALSPSQASTPFWRRAGFVAADELLVYRLPN